MVAVFFWLIALPALLCVVESEPTPGLVFTKAEVEAMLQKFREQLNDPNSGLEVLGLTLKLARSITLTGANHLVILDPWWNPAVEDQAADRAHRIGQENPVLVHRMVARDTVEEKILQLQEKKRALAQAAMGGAAAAASLSRDDLVSLLS